MALLCGCLNAQVVVGAPVAEKVAIVDALNRVQCI